MDVNSRKLTEDLKKSARKDPEKSARQVYDEVLTETLNNYQSDRYGEIISSLPDFIRCRSSIQWARGEFRPALPSSLEEVEIDGQWAKTTEGERFKLFEIPGAKKVVAFATDLMLKHLYASPVVIMDGTFRVSPLLFSQLYTLQAKFRGAIFPMMYVLLPDKTRETYEAVLFLIV